MTVAIAIAQFFNSDESPWEYIIRLVPRTVIRGSDRASCSRPAVARQQPFTQGALRKQLVRAA
jgi:hypothetical protein